MPALSWDAEVGYPLIVFNSPCPLNLFQQQQPKALFLLAEAQFTFAMVYSQQTSSYYVVAALSRAIALELFNILSSSPAKAPYDTVKAAVLKLLISESTVSLTATQQLSSTTLSGGAQGDIPSTVLQAASPPLTNSKRVTSTVSQTSLQGPDR